MPITEVMKLPYTEYEEWLWFFNEKDRRERAEKGDLMAMDDEDMVGSLRALGVVE